VQEVGCSSSSPVENEIVPKHSDHGDILVEGYALSESVDYSNTPYSVTRHKTCGERNRAAKTGRKLAPLKFPKDALHSGLGFQGCAADMH
jgi:hypothetical protein